MSLYTTEVRFICETAAGYTESQGASKIEEIISAAIPKIFDFDFPIFDESYRFNLEKKILRHFYLREIGQETVGLWKFYLSQKLNEIMPYYNQLYKSELLSFNPLYDVDLTREHNITGTNDKSSTSSSDASTKQVSKYSDTPQGGLQNVEEGTYLTSATVDDNTGSNTNNSNEAIDSTEHYLETVQGMNGGASAAKRLMDYRKTFLNIDMQVINDLEPLFFGLWR